MTSAERISRIQRIIREWKNPLKGRGLVRTELQAEWGVTGKTMWMYEKSALKRLKSAHTREANETKAIYVDQIEGLLPHCSSVDPDSGETVVRVEAALKVYQRLCDLQGLDSPKQIIQSTDVTLFEKLGLTNLVIDAKPDSAQIPAEPTGQTD